MLAQLYHSTSGYVSSGHALVDPYLYVDSNLVDPSLYTLNLSDGIVNASAVPQASEVPEPGTILLTGSGLLMALRRARGRTRRHA